VGIQGVSFRLSFIPLRLRGYAYRCMFCGRSARTTTAQGRAEAMRRHAAKDNADAEAGGRALPR
jgi:hypothetical protein